MAGTSRKDPVRQSADRNSLRESWVKLVTAVVTMLGVVAGVAAALFFTHKGEAAPSPGMGVAGSPTPAVASARPSPPAESPVPHAPEGAAIVNDFRGPNEGGGPQVGGGSNFNGPVEFFSGHAQKNVYPPEDRKAADEEKARERRQHAAARKAVERSVRRYAEAFENPAPEVTGNLLHAGKVLSKVETMEYDPTTKTMQADVYAEWCNAGDPWGSEPRSCHMLFTLHERSNGEFADAEPQTYDDNPKLADLRQSKIWIDFGRAWIKSNQRRSASNTPTPTPTLRRTVRVPAPY